MTHLGELLSAFLDGELRSGEERTVLAHLSECADCRAELTELDAARTAVRALPVLEPPSTLGVPALGPRRRRRRIAEFVAAAAAVLAVVFAVGLARGGPEAGPVDIAQVVDQHVSRASVDPGLPAFDVVSVVVQP